MHASEILEVISEAISQAESEAFEETVKARAEEGWANPTLQAQNEWQGDDNRIICGTFAEALEALKEYGEVPTGCPDYDPEKDGDPQHFLVNHLDSAGVIGDGAPLAYVGVDGYFTLICEGATKEEIEQAAVDCLPSD
jgi:hypothetical protein